MKTIPIFSELVDAPVNRVHCVTRVENGVKQPIEVAIAEEIAVAVSYDGTTHAVMMATPDDLAEFAVGFSLTENIISDISEIDEINIIRLDDGVDIQLRLDERPRNAFLKRRRHMAGPVGCGLCGIESIEAAMRIVPQYKGGLTITANDVCDAVGLLNLGQKLNQLTRCAHAAGFYVAGQGLLAICEDIGRHNAVDKLIGTLLLQNVDIGFGAIVVTSRLSVEIIQKAAIAGSGIVIGISAPTAEALRIGKAANLTVIARARGQSFEIHSHAERIL
ncbi:formate dehydrogenase accessory sulfurtransferase FdhD [Bartonella sp. HY329]|uniref:formate dehydrogenase accessory sulfurtransferase FdhD n=1 Tax=unclassified Bartonella TaxID=2645622 RepID=UPI0021C86DC4|nr:MULTISPECIES: formate dehydrogenase accessory sulfurtransferase FdhD [unclassified Bartonella]UXM95889.1 formate dehydrogenase accessory sulfurtransferase FdhD [Bartonella sp. HY329]UXN10214.1 formate dehydrogenase accessory sulfurtransferase FdhD [Bartonella sp. HY328]